MEKDIIFIVRKDGNKNLVFAKDNLSKEDALTLLGMISSIVYNIGTKEIGLTHEECKDNIDRAVEIGIEYAKEKMQ